MGIAYVVLKVLDVLGLRPDEFVESGLAFVVVEKVGVVEMGDLCECVRLERVRMR